MLQFMCAKCVQMACASFFSHRRHYFQKIFFIISFGWCAKIPIMDHVTFNLRALEWHKTISFTDFQWRERESVCSLSPRSWGRLRRSVTIASSTIDAVVLCCAWFFFSFNLFITPVLSPPFFSHFGKNAKFHPILTAFIWKVNYTHVLEIIFICECNHVVWHSVELNMWSVCVRARLFMESVCTLQFTHKYMGLFGENCFSKADGGGRHTWNLKMCAFIS